MTAFTLTGVVPAQAATYAPADWATLHSTFNAATTGDTIVLNADITATAGESLTVLANQSVVLDLNGHTLTIASPTAGAAGIQVGASESLTINDTTGLGTLTVTGGSSASGIGGASPG